MPYPPLLKILSNIMLKKNKEKTFYVCDSCKKVGIKSYKVKTFEPFDCPVCKKQTTLFLPIKKKEILEEKVVEPIKEIISKETELKKEIVSSKISPSLNFCIFFMIGFITALILTK